MESKVQPILSDEGPFRLILALHSMRDHDLAEKISGFKPN